MTHKFEPVARRTLAAEVRQRLLSSIESGAIGPGEMIPSERVLCEEFGVARTSVREAIQGLSTLGVLERRGNRTYVSEQLPELDLQGERTSQIRDIFEVRRLLELPLAELVATRATDEERADICRRAKEFKAGMSISRFRELDREFHVVLARAAHNPVLTEVYLKVLERLFTSDDFHAMLTARRNKEPVARIISDAGRDHRAIADAVARGDVDSTVGAVEAHLSQVEDRMVSQLT